MTNPNGKVPIIGANALDPQRIAFIEANYDQFASQVSAMMTLLKPMPLREMLEASKKRRAAATLAVLDQQQYAATMDALENERRILEAAIALQRVLRAER